MEKYIINFSRKIEYIVRKNNAEDLGIKWDRFLEDVFTFIPIRQFCTHVALASCKDIDEVIDELSKKEGKLLTEQALIKRAQRTVTNVLSNFSKNLADAVERKNRSQS